MHQYQCDCNEQCNIPLISMRQLRSFSSVTVVARARVRANLLAVQKSLATISTDLLILTNGLTDKICLSQFGQLESKYKLILKTRPLKNKRRQSNNNHHANKYNHRLHFSLAFVWSDIFSFELCIHSIYYLHTNT